MSWYQKSEEWNHEFLVQGVFPFEITVGLFQILGNLEESLVGQNEFFEQKVSEDVNLLVDVKLIVELTILIIFKTD